MWNGNFVVTKTSFFNFSIPDFNSPFRKNKCGFYSRAAFNYFVKGICAASIQENTATNFNALIMH